MSYPRHLWFSPFWALVLLQSGMLKSAWACTVCWGGSESLAWAFAVSSYLLIGTPFLVLGTILGGASLLQRRLQKQRVTRGDGDVALAVKTRA